MIPNQRTSPSWPITAIPALIGLGLAWMGVTLVKNEKRLLLRRLELQAALEETSKNVRRDYLLGK